jgi:crossover junction endodeoxyribonuclease RuvC
MGARLGQPRTRQGQTETAQPATGRADRTGEGETKMILGIDIGVTGAVAVLDLDGKLIEVQDMPCLEDGPRNRRTINAPLFAELIYKTHGTRAYVEKVGPMPREGAVGAFAFGRSAGIIAGVLAAAAIPVLYVTPPVWKRAVGVPPGKEMKDASRSNAIRRWPDKAELFKRKLDHGRADAALIGLAGILRYSDLEVIGGAKLEGATARRKA